MKLKTVLLIATAVALTQQGAWAKTVKHKKHHTVAMAANTGPANAGSTAGQGGAVSAPRSNGAVNTGGNAGSKTLAAASNSFTSGEAKSHIESAGYTDVTSLMKTPDGLWTAKATQDGKPVDVALDFKGAVTSK